MTERPNRAADSLVLTPRHLNPSSRPARREASNTPTAIPGDTSVVHAEYTAADLRIVDARAAILARPKIQGIPKLLCIHSNDAATGRPKMSVFGSHRAENGALIVHTADMDQGGRQELHYRALDGDVAGIQERLAAGDDIAHADAQGFTALHFAAQQSHTDAVAALLAAGAPVDATDQLGNTPLWRAVFNDRGRTGVIGLLLAARADPDIANASGVSPRALAERMGASAALERP